MRILVTRPIQDSEEIARRLGGMGHQALLAPLQSLKFLEGTPLDLAGVQAVLVTSANGARALARRTPYRHVAVFAVGPQSADAARQAGFLRVQSAGGNAMALAQTVARRADPAAGLLLHVSGEESGDALCEKLTAQGFLTKRDVLYRMERAANLTPDAAVAIRQKAVQAVLLFSPNGAALFADCVTREKLPTDSMIAICISPNTAQALKGLSFAEIRIARTPDQDALLTCL